MGRRLTEYGYRRQRGSGNDRVSVMTLLRVNRMLTSEWQVKKYYIDSYPATKNWSRVTYCLNLLVHLGLADTKGHGRGAVFYRKNIHLTNPQKLREELFKEIKDGYKHTYNVVKQRKKYNALYNEYKTKLLSLKTKVAKNHVTKQVNTQLWKEHSKVYDTNKLEKKSSEKEDEIINVACEGCGFELDFDISKNEVTCPMCLKKIERWK